MHSMYKYRLLAVYWSMVNVYQPRPLRQTMDVRLQYFCKYIRGLRLVSYHPTLPCKSFLEQTKLLLSSLVTIFTSNNTFPVRKVRVAYWLTWQDWKNIKKIKHLCCYTYITCSFVLGCGMDVQKMSFLMEVSWGRITYQIHPAFRYEVISLTDR